jgi:hypothetical protein
VNATGAWIPAWPAGTSEEVRRSGPARGAQSLAGAAEARGRCRCRRAGACGRGVHWQRALCCTYVCREFLWEGREKPSVMKSALAWCGLATAQAADAAGLLQPGTRHAASASSSGPASEPVAANRSRPATSAGAVQRCAAPAAVQTGRQDVPQGPRTAVQQPIHYCARFRQHASLGGLASLPHSIGLQMQPAARCPAPAALQLHALQPCSATARAPRAPLPRRCPRACQRAWAACLSSKGRRGLTSDGDERLIIPNPSPTLYNIGALRVSKFISQADTFHCVHSPSGVGSASDSALQSLAATRAQC